MTYEERSFCVYILSTRRNDTLYVGVTNSLSRRVFEHRTGAVPGFTKTYAVTMLVWYERYPTIIEAIAAEKRIKRWRREWKINAIERMNPQRLDLYETLNQ